MKRLLYKVFSVTIGMIVSASSAITAGEAQEQETQTNETDCQYECSPPVAGIAKELIEAASGRDSSRNAVIQHLSIEKLEPYSVWTDEERYLLAKLAMAEAESESFECKELVIKTVLNRVDNAKFPYSIHDVIYQYDPIKDVYQFSCVGDGRFYSVEPNEECFEAVQNVENYGYKDSAGALYFENCEDEDNWHSRNLEFLYQCDSMRFYK